LDELLHRWRTGDQQAAFDIYKRYEQRVQRYAQRRIGQLLRPRVQSDSVVLLVLESALMGVAEGRYDANSSSAFLNLLEQMAENKIRKKWEYFIAEKRDIRREIRPDDSLDHLDFSPSKELSPHEVGVLADELENIRSRLSPQLFEVFQFLLEGYSCADIANELNCSWHTVWRRTTRLRQLLQQWSGDSQKNS
jgi:RNA polymerase sigma-70 factor (ECF subfamily)